MTLGHNSCCSCYFYHSAIQGAGGITVLSGSVADGGGYLVADPGTTLLYVTEAYGGTTEKFVSAIVSDLSDSLPADAIMRLFPNYPDTSIYVEYDNNAGTYKLIGDATDQWTFTAPTTFPFQAGISTRVCASKAYLADGFANRFIPITGNSMTSKAALWVQSTSSLKIQLFAYDDRTIGQPTNIGGGTCGAVQICAPLATTEDIGLVLSGYPDCYSIWTGASLAARPDGVGFSRSGTLPDPGECSSGPNVVTMNAYFCESDCKTHLELTLPNGSLTYLVDGPKTPADLSGIDLGTVVGDWSRACNCDNPDVGEVEIGVTIA